MDIARMRSSSSTSRFNISAREIYGFYGRQLDYSHRSSGLWNNVNWKESGYESLVGLLKTSEAAAIFGFI